MAEDHHHHHVTPWPYYLVNVLGLMTLMGLTIWASTWQLPSTWMNNVVALVIAITKMMMVILIFMGVKWSTRLTKLWAATGFVWFLLMGLTFGDYATRGWENIPTWNPDHVGYPVPPLEPHHGGSEGAEH